MSAASTGDGAVSVRVDAAAPGGNRRRWLILAVIATAQLMVVLDGTVVNIALPTAQRALGFTNADRQWIITGYARVRQPAAAGRHTTFPSRNVTESESR